MQTNNSTHTSFNPTSNLQFAHSFYLNSTANELISDSFNDIPDPTPSKLTIGESNLYLYDHLAPCLYQHGFDPYSIYFNVSRIAFTIFKAQHRLPKQNDSNYISTRYTKRYKKYLCPLPQYNVTFQLHYELGCANTIKNMHIHLYLPASLPDAHIYTGGIKKVKKSVTLKLPNGDIRETQIIPSVVQRFLEAKKNVPENLEGINIQKKLNSLLDPDHQLASDPWVIQYFSKNLITKYEFVQKWYNGDLKTAISSLPLEPHKSAYAVSITRSEKIDALIKLTETLDSCHQFGYVHGDVKPENILLEIGKNLQIKSRLSDFDFTQSIGENNFQTKPYIYWDDCFLNNIVLPSADLHGLCYTIATTLLPLYSNCLLSQNSGANEITLGKILQHQAIINIQRRMPYLKHVLETLYCIKNPTKEDIICCINIKFQEEERKPSCSEFTQKELKCLSAEIKAYYIVIKLLADQIVFSKQLWIKLSADVEMQETLKLGTLEEKQIAYMQLSQSLSYSHTAKDIGKILRDIQELFDASI